MHHQPVSVPVLEEGERLQEVRTILIGAGDAGAYHDGDDLVALVLGPHSNALLLGVDRVATRDRGAAVGDEVHEKTVL